MNEQEPLLVVIAGPMGAGKTTFYDAHLKEAFPVLIPPVPHQREAMLRERRSFAVEDLIVDAQLLENARDADSNESRRAVSAAEHNSGVVQAVHEKLAGAQFMADDTLQPVRGSAGRLH